ncbi:MAG TPA: helix-turn-helix domain-containing protein [Bacteroidia bacterium]|nr:helix-turn-helix domain-containing protein [Bacteroidia bacterium]HNS13177.1 helix-turn-helix domain-containing protein [Bacteroidia bacterium]
MGNFNRLYFEERAKIETYFTPGWTIRRIADKLGRSKSTISREIAR